MDKYIKPDSDKKNIIDEGESGKIPRIKDASIFASFGSPHGFVESKKIGYHSDILSKTTRFKDTEFSTSLQILEQGDKKVTIHFPHLESNSSRGGGHAGMAFVFDKDTQVDTALIEKLLPLVIKFRDANFSKEGDVYRIKTNDPRKIAPLDFS